MEIEKVNFTMVGVEEQSGPKGVTVGPAVETDKL